MEPGVPLGTRLRMGSGRKRKHPERQQPLPETPAIPERDYCALAAGYRADVLSGAIVAGTWAKLACRRQARDLELAEIDREYPYVWSPSHVTEACHFIECLPHVEGTWATERLQLEPAQLFILACMFGWRHRADLRRRRYTQVYWEMGRKGAKSTLCAAIALVHLALEGEVGPQVICGATTGDQARIVFTIAQKMVRKAPWLRNFGLEAFAHSITSEDGHMKPINAAASTQDGLNPSCVILDESHAQKFALHDVLKSAQGARRNPLMVCPTTAGYDLLSVGYALRTTLTKVLTGELEADHLFGIIFGLDEGDDWRDERNWIKANPLLGTAPLIDQMRRQCLDAQHTPSLEGEFRVKCMSQWQNAATTWLSLTHWDACADRTLRLEDFAGESCWIGCDLAQRDDLAAAALVFCRGNILYAFVRCYLPEGVVADRARLVPAYRLWVEHNELITTPGTMIDYGRIEADIRGWCEQFVVRDICFDQFGAFQMTGALFNDGHPARTEQKNARTCTGPARELESRVTYHRFVHEGNTCVRWQAGNVVVTRGVDDSMVPKKESAMSPKKIDAIDAIVSAIGGWLRVGETEQDYTVSVVA
jgi:phage terminase large subunit-like protein